MKKFDLWLDESGDFKDDDKKVKHGKTPSCVCGVLVESGALGNSTLQKWFKTEVHCCKTVSGQEQMEYLERLQKQQGVRFVVVVNEELINFTDDQNTYFYMLAEGIIQVLKRLKGEYGEVQLNILIATRVKGRENKSSAEFKKDQCEKDIQNLKLHLVLAGYRDGGISEEDWKITADKPSDNPRLQVADIICNTYLTRNTKLGEYSQMLNQVFCNEEKTWKFTMAPDKYTSLFYDMLSKGELGAAVLGLCQSPSSKDIHSGMLSVRQRLSSYPHMLLKLQLEYISSQLQYLVICAANAQVLHQEECVSLIENIKKYFLPIVEEISEEAVREFIVEFSFDLEFLLLTVYTHMGNWQKEEELITKCDAMLPDLLATWSNTDKVLRYQNRRLIHQINSYDFDGAYEVFSEKRSHLVEIVEFMTIVNGNQVKYNEYAKFLGTGVQILQAKIRHDKDIYGAAVELSECAINAFEDTMSKRRQYQYRSMIETDAEEFERALVFLKKSVGLAEDADNKEILDKMGNNEFSWMYLIRLVAEGFLSKCNAADKLFDLMKKNPAFNQIAENGARKHPYEIIMWKLATCWAVNNQFSAAMKYYKKCIDFCFEGKNFTLWIIGYAALLEEYAYALRVGNKEVKVDTLKKDLVRYHKKIMGENMSASIKDIYKEIDFEKMEWEYFFQLSRKVTY